MKTNESSEFNRQTQTKVFSFFKAIVKFDFIANLLKTYQVIELSLLVTQLLKSKKNDITDNIQMTTSLINGVHFLRLNIDSFHHQIFEKILVITTRLIIPLSKPRINKR